MYETDPDTGVYYGSRGRLIRDGWPALPGQSVRIPDNLDAAYFDQRDNNIYFFKGSLVCLKSYFFSLYMTHEIRSWFSYISLNYVTSTHTVWSIPLNTENWKGKQIFVPILSTLWLRSWIVDNETLLSLFYTNFRWVLESGQMVNPYWKWRRGRRMTSCPNIWHCFCIFLLCIVTTICYFETGFGSSHENFKLISVGWKNDRYTAL